MQLNSLEKLLLKQALKWVQSKVQAEINKEANKNVKAVLQAFDTAAQDVLTQLLS